MKKVTDKFLKEAQLHFKKYLQNYKNEKNMTKEQLAVALGCSRANIDKLMSTTVVSSPVKAIKTLSDFASLDETQGHTPVTFLKMLMGTLNEIGEPSQYTMEIAELFQTLSTTSQGVLKRALKKNPERLSAMSSTIDDIAKSSQVKSQLYKKIKDLNENEAKGLLLMLKNFKGESK